jgi:hypothetical protein
MNGLEVAEDATELFRSNETVTAEPLPLLLDVVHEISLLFKEVHVKLWSLSLIFGTQSLESSQMG